MRMKRMQAETDTRDLLTRAEVLLIIRMLPDELESVETAAAYQFAGLDVFHAIAQTPS